MVKLPDSVKLQNQPLFLSYANLRFKDNPENIYRLFDEIDKFGDEYFLSVQGLNREDFTGTGADADLIKLDGRPYHSAFEVDKKILNEIVRLTKMGFNNSTLQEHDDIRRGASRSFDYCKSAHYIAFEAVYGYHDMSCMQCDYFIEEDRATVLESFGFAPALPSVHHLTCIECQQFAFISLIDQIIQGYAYDQLCGFCGYLGARNENVKSTVLEPVGDSLKEEIYFSPSGSVSKCLFPSGITSTVMRDYKGLFSEMLRGIIGFSLVEFLLKKGRYGKQYNRAKIKKCDACGLYYCSKTIKKQEHSFCSDDCRNKYNYNRPGKEERREKVNKFKRVERQKGNLKYY